MMYLEFYMTHSKYFSHLLLLLSLIISLFSWYEKKIRVQDSLRTCLNVVAIFLLDIYPSLFLKTANSSALWYSFASAYITSLSCYLAFYPLSLQPLQPHVRVWDSVSLATLQIIGLGTFERGVGCLDFSKAVSNKF